MSWSGHVLNCFYSLFRDRYFSTTVTPGNGNTEVVSIRCFATGTSRQPHGATGARDMGSFLFAVSRQVLLDTTPAGRMALMLVFLFAVSRQVLLDTTLVFN